MDRIAASRLSQRPRRGLECSGVMLWRDHSRRTLRTPNLWVQPTGHLYKQKRIKSINVMVPTILEGLSDEVRRGFSTYIIGLCMELHYSFAAPFFGVLLLFFLISETYVCPPRLCFVFVHMRENSARAWPPWPIRNTLHQAPFISDS